MNKTVNINLANIFFHIDEDAYEKLRRYLAAIRKTFDGTPGGDEILADIEARIAELFTERIKNERQVIGMKEVDEIIGIMGQPEDYMLDEELFEEDKARKGSTQQRPYRRLFRDTDKQYVAGVSAGLSHYLGIDAIWVRLIFLVLTLAGSGFGILAYILFWILVPPARNTSEKLEMTGEPVNISNIEKKVKEGFQDMSDRIKNVDYDKAGERVKQGARNFFDSLGEVILFLFGIFAKFLGVILILIGGVSLIALFLSLFTIGILGFSFPWSEWIYFTNMTDVPLWVISLLVFFVIGIPFFFLFLLGLKILVNNLKPIGNIAKFTILGLWLISILALLYIGLGYARERSYGGSVIEESTSMIRANDTLKIMMSIPEEIDHERWNRSKRLFHFYGDDHKYWIDYVEWNLKQSTDSLIHLKIYKEADGPSYEKAKEYAEKIDYNTELKNNNTLVFNSTFKVNIDDKLRKQEVNITLYVPIGTQLKLDPNTASYLDRKIKNDQDYGRFDLGGHTWKMGEDGELKCMECPKADSLDVKVNTSGLHINVNSDHDKIHMSLDEDGMKIQSKS